MSNGNTTGSIINNRALIVIAIIVIIVIIIAFAIAINNNSRSQVTSVLTGSINRYKVGKKMIGIKKSGKNRDGSYLSGKWLKKVDIVDIKSLNVKNANIAIKLSKLHLDIIQATFPFLSPPFVGRSLMMVNSAMYNSMTAYYANLKAVFTDECNLKIGSLKYNEDKLKYSMIIAVELVVNSIFKTRKKALKVFNDEIKKLMKSENLRHYVDGYKVCKNSANVILTRFLNDGSNQLGNEEGTSNELSLDEKPFSDYTNYEASNVPQDIPGITTCSKLKYINQWQQLKVPTEDGKTKIRPFMSPQCAMVKPFALDGPDQFRPSTPYQLNTNTHNKQMKEIKEVVRISGRLGDREKVIAEYWADGIDSTLPGGHWQHIAISMAIKKDLDLYETTLLLFLQACAAFDAGLCCWAAKRYFNFARPITMIQCSLAGVKAKAWSGPYQGVDVINLSKWQPYQNKYFVSPPFSESPSGHSTFSSASAEVLARFFGSDEMGLSDTVKKGESLFEPKIVKGEKGYIAGVTDVPNSGPETKGYVPAKDVTLSWKTFTEAANEAGFSRLYGGIHFRKGNEEGLKLGRKVAGVVWDKFVDLTGYE